MKNPITPLMISSSSLTIRLFEELLVSFSDIAFSKVNTTANGDRELQALDGLGYCFDQRFVVLVAVEIVVAKRTVNLILTL